MIRVPLIARLDVDPVAKSASIVFSVPADDGEGDVDVFMQDITAGLSVEDKRRLRHLFSPS